MDAIESLLGGPHRARFDELGKSRLLGAFSLSSWFAGAQLLLGNITAFHRMPAPLAMTSIAVKTCVPSGWSGLSIVTGISNSGARPCRTKIFFSLRLTNMANCPERLAGCSAAQ